jgi:hypothetical protein
MRKVALVMQKVFSATVVMEGGERLIQNTVEMQL